MGAEREGASRRTTFSTARVLRRVNLDSAQGDFLLYRFHVAHPWPECAALPHMHADRLLGRISNLPGV